MIEARTYRITGRVQGVGFRWFTWDAATREGLTGHVRNDVDGSVEALVEGEHDALDRFERAISSGPRGSRVDAVHREAAAVTGGFHDFSVRG